MPEVSFAVMRKLAAMYGHEGLTVVQLSKPDVYGRTSWRGECGCGYRTTRRNSSADAAGALVHHVEKVSEYLTPFHPRTHGGKGSTPPPPAGARERLIRQIEADTPIEDAS